MEKSNPNNIEELVQKAKAGDKYAQSQLYESYYNSIYYTIKTIVKDEDTTLDLVQDTFLKGFTHLNSLDNAAVFLPWLKRIATNNAKNWLRKKQPLLFSQMTEKDDEGEEQPVDFQDMDLTKQPEEALDAKTKKQLLWDIIDELSDEQRLVINMFYFQQMSVSDIAQMLEVSPNTVKSRLNYGRKKIEAKVLDLEKHGTKLYGLAPIAFFIWLFLQNQKFNPVLPVAISAAGVGSAATGSGASATAGASKAAGTTAAKGIGIKIAAGVTAAAVVGGIAAGAVSMSTPKLYSWYMKPSVVAQDINLPVQTVIDYIKDGFIDSKYWQLGYTGNACYIKTDTGVGIVTYDGTIITPTTYTSVSVEEKQNLVLHDDTGAYVVSVPDGALTPYVKSEKQQELEEKFKADVEEELELYTPDRYDRYEFEFNGPGVYSNKQESNMYNHPVDDVGGIQDGLIAYMVDSKWGYLDGETYEPVITPKYAPSWHVDESVMDISNLYYYRYLPYLAFFYYRPESTNPKEGKGTYQADRAYDASDGFIVVNIEGKGLRTFYWTKWPPTSLFYIPLDLVRQETALFAYPGTKPYTNQYAV